MTATTATRVEINGAEYFVHANVAHEIARLREALEPFAREAEQWPDYVPDSDGLFIASPDDVEPILDEYASESGRASAGISYSNDIVTVGDLRRAREIYGRNLDGASGE